MRRFVTRESKKDFYILYTLVFGIISFFIYYQFADNGKSLLWSHDGIPQHLNSLAYYGRYLRNVLHTILVEHKLSLPMWDMNIGYGSDILTTLHYYVIGDPLTLLSVFVPADKTETLYEVLIFLRIYLAGISFSIFCFYHKNPKQATFMGTLIYIFAGWTIYAAMKHPYFSNPMIYLPLVLMGIDKIYKKEKPWLFIWATVISAMSNFYFFYMICIFMFIYATFRYFGIFSKRSVKDVFDWLVKFIGYYAVALMIAAVIFLPVIMTLFGTDRFQAENYVPLLYDKIYYEKYLGNLIGENMIQWGVAGYSAVAMAGVFVLFSKKKKYLDLKWGFVLLNLFLLVPFAGHVFFLCIKSLDLGVWHDDRLYFCKSISGIIYSDGERKEEDFYYGCSLLCTCFVRQGSADTAKYGGCTDSGACCIYRNFFWKYFSSGEIYVRHAQRAFGSQYSAECVLSVFL